MLLLLGLASGSVCLAPAHDSCTDPRKEALEENVGAIGVGLGTWPAPQERDWVVDFWGLARGLRLRTKGELLEDGGLRIRVKTSHVMMTETYIVLDLHRAPGGGFRCEARVTEGSEASPVRTWKSPRGLVVVSPDDWSRCLEPGTPPFLVEFRLHDVPMDGNSCVRGIVVVSKRDQ